MKISEEEYCICVYWKDRDEDEYMMIWQHLFSELSLRFREKKGDEKYNFSWKPEFLDRYHCSNWATLIYPVELLDLTKSWVKFFLRFGIDYVQDLNPGMSGER